MQLSTLLLLLQLHLLILLPVVLTQIDPEDYNCFAEDKEQRFVSFSSKSAYSSVYNKKQDKEMPHCKPVQIWMLARHGTRYPREKEIKKLRELLTLRKTILNNYEERNVKKGLCEADLSNLKKWDYILTEDLENDLTRQGTFDLLFLGVRMRYRFPMLNDAADFSPDDIERHFEFRFTKSERTKDSAKAFSDGIFQSTQFNMPAAIDNDPLLKSYANCPVWEQETDSPANKREVTLFEEGPLMKGVIASISQRLGFNYSLTLNQVDLMYEMCRYEKAWHLHAKPAWCAAFSRRELKVLEYDNDLTYYYKAGYGNAMNNKVACPLVKDMFDKFNKTVNLQNPNLTDVKTLGSFYFTHTSMILLLLDTLVIAYDKVPLRHNNFANQTNRLWRTSQIDPFGANLVAVLYKCSQGDVNQIAFYLNEHIVDYPGCNQGFCSWSFFESKFKSVVDPKTCNLEFCFKKESPTLTSVLMTKLRELGTTFQRWIKNKLPKLNRG